MQQKDTLASCKKIIKSYSADIIISNAYWSLLFLLQYIQQNIKSQNRQHRTNTANMRRTINATRLYPNPKKKKRWIVSNITQKLLVSMHACSYTRTKVSCKENKQFIIIGNYHTGLHCSCSIFHASLYTRNKVCPLRAWH